MKISLSLLLTVILISVFTLTAKTQTQPVHRTCATDEMMQQVFNNDPAARARYENTQRLLESRIKSVLNNQQTRIQAIVTIPVVVHIGLPDPSIVTDAIVQSQLDTLNYYYGSQPIGDSLRVYPPFRPAYGRSEIRFCLAQRTPANVTTTGIERVINSTVYVNTHPSADLGTWDPTKYLNIWVVQLGNGILGYSFLPGVFQPNDPRNGFVNDYRAFGSGPAISSGGYHYDAYNLGKTAVHEIGHFFNLYHPWSDASNAASNPSCTLDDGCGDTPKSAGPIFNCPTSPVTNTCAPVDPGVMFQNHMDYADDACMLLFTVNQCSRMSASLTLADRVGLTTSNGCQPILTGPNDAQILSILQPQNGSFSPVCSNIPLSVTLRNSGTNNLTSAVINIRDNGTLIATQNFAGLLTPNATTIIALANIAPATPGLHIIKVHTTLPNGVPDSSPANDTSTISIIRNSIVDLPPFENFEGPSFPLPNWVISNPDNNVTWVKKTNAGYLSYKSAFIDNYNFDRSNQVDDIVTPVFKTTGSGGAQADSIIITWDMATRYYPLAPYDTFSVRTSSDCGNTFPNVLFNASNSVLGISDANDFIAPTETDWKNYRTSIGGAVLNSGIHTVAFRNKNEYGNNFFVDNINVSLLFKRDISVVTVNKPTAECSSTFTPNVTVRNIGTETVTGFSISYQINNGAIQTTNFTGQNIARNAQVNVNLPANATTLATGAHTITIFSFNPVTASGTGDQFQVNDTLIRSFSMLGTVADSLKETFENNSFPPAGWGIVNPDSDINWSRSAVGNNNPGSAYMSNWNNLGRGQLDFLHSPGITYSGVDSIILSFDISAVTKIYANNPQIPVDTFEVLVTTNCGNSFTSVYKKWGNELQTVGSASDPKSIEFFPASSSQWRQERIDLSAFGPNGTLRIVFKNRNGFGNNVFIDNVNVKTRILPSNLKANGIVIFPSPFKSTFQIWHLRTPSNLRFINIYNSAGQKVWSKQYNNDALKTIDVDLGRNAAGIYIVELAYNDSQGNLDKPKTQQIRIIKTN